MIAHRHLLFLTAAAALLFLPVPAHAGGCGSCGAHGPAAASKAPDIVDTAVKAGSFNTLVTAVKAADLAGVLKSDGPFTVFAPADSAFAKLPEGAVKNLLADKAKLRTVLTYHVVPGKLMAADVIGKSWLKTAQGQSLRITATDDEVRVDDARIVKTDIVAGNGVIHVIDSVVLPRKDIVATAAEAGTFETLLAAAKAAGLADVLKSDGPYTIFAPTDAAFAKLPEGTVEALLKDREKLAAILTYHVVPGRILSTDLKVGETRARTVQGGSLEVVRSNSGGVTANGTNVIAADVIAGNGVIHVVDSVILPR